MRPAFLDSMSWAMAEVYASVTDRILINLAHYFPYIEDEAEVKGAFEYQARMLGQIGQVNSETIKIIAGSLDGADAALKQTLEAAILDALKTEEPKLRKAAMQGLLYGPGFTPPEVTPSMMQAFRLYYQQSADKLNLVNTVMLESTEAAYRATVGDVTAQIARTQTILNTETGQVVTGVSSYNTAMRDGVRRMVDNGLTGFIDHGGHHWSPEAYVAMDIRTTMFNTARAAVWERNQEYGNDLYQVSSKAAARPLCYPWQGKVLSSSGRTGVTVDLDGNEVIIHSEDEVESFRYGGGLFGVNCGHYPMVFIPGVSTIKPPPQDEEENAEAYAESQQQRALERKLREEKRDLEVMKAQGAPEDQIKAQRARVRKASSELDDFCDETGRARQRSREGAPVNAKWPQTNTGTQTGGTQTKNVAQQATISPQNVVQYNQPNTYTIVDATKTVETVRLDSGPSYAVYHGDVDMYTMPDGTKFGFKRGMNKAHQSMTPEAAIDEWYKLPAELRNLANKEIYFVDRYNPADAYWRKHYKNFTHSYATGGDYITYYRYDQKHDMVYFRESLSHEIAHQIDTNLGLSGSNYSAGAEWQKAMADDLAATGKKSITTYGENSAREDFAESVKYYIKDPQAFMQAMPSRGGLIMKIITGGTSP